MGKTKCKVLFAAVLCLIVSLGLLTGCGSKPKDAKELVDFSTEAMKKVESAHVDVDGSFDIGMNFEGATSKEYEDYSKMDIPIDMNGSFDASKEVLAGNYDLSLFVMGFDETISSEVYSDLKSDPKVTYQREKGSDQWVKSVSEETGENKDAALDQETIDKAKEYLDRFLKYAEMKETDSGYTITIDMTKVDPQDFRDLLGDALKEGEEVDDTGMTESLDALMNDVTVKSGTLTADFEAKTFYMTSFALDNFVVESKIDTKTMGYEDMFKSGTGSVKIDFLLNCSDFNSVDKAKLTIPEDVVKNAVDESDSSNFDFGGESDLGGDEEINIGGGEEINLDDYEFEPGDGVTVEEEPKE